jgi:hypothetical protein
MSDWSPDNDAPDDGPPEGEEGSGDGIARVLTMSPIALRLVVTPHPRQPAGQVVFRAHGTLEGEATAESPVLAQGALPEALFEAVQRVGLFARPVPLLLTARNDEGGVRAILSAIVPSRDVERAERESRAADEPWLASVAEEPDVASIAPGDEEAEVPHVPFALGVILRFAEDRKHPDQLDHEAVDLLATLLAGRAMDADRKRVENLLKSL